MRRGEGFRRVEAEIRREQAEALGRTGERLEAVLRELAERDRRLDHLVEHARGPTRPAPVTAEVDARNRLRGERSSSSTP